MPKKSDLLPGTLDMLILKTLTRAPQHGYGIALSIKHVMTRRYAVLNAWPVMWLGAISYSLYLWQQIFLNRGSSSLWTAFPQNLVLSILLATASYHVVERPSLKLRERWTGRRPQLVERVSSSPSSSASEVGEVPRTATG